ncbi:MAG: hypothetical protein QOK05_2813 [Chloroflexota bacterium]|nr:hypothetical protein [Chloroflexota bacterium]
MTPAALVTGWTALQPTGLVSGRPSSAPPAFTQPSEQVLAASTGPGAIMAVSKPALMATGSPGAGVAHAYQSVSSGILGFGAQFDRLKLAFMVAWLALNGAVLLLIRNRRGQRRKGDFIPISLGAFTYRDGTALRAYGSGGVDPT